jgi:hypothetical protein
MALPTDRDYDAAPGEEIRSDAYNHMQDVIIANQAAIDSVSTKRDKTRTLQLGPSDFLPDVPGNWQHDPTAGSGDSEGWVGWKRLLGSGTVALLVASLALEVGEQVTGYTVYISEPNTGGGNRSSAELQLVEMASGNDEPSALVASTGGPGATTITDAAPELDSGGPVQITGASRRVQLTVSTKYVGAVVYGATISIAPIP